MTLRSSDGWRAQAPSTDFAARTTAAIVADRHQPLSTTLSQARLRRAVLVAAATLLVGTAAWAWHTRPSLPRSEPGQALLAPMPYGSAVEEDVAGPRLSPLPSAPVAATARRAPKAAPPPSAATVAPAVSASSARPVVVPPCRCNEFACDCGPEP